MSHGVFLVKRLLLSDRARPSWTVTDAVGRQVFEEERNGYRVLQTWALKRDAARIAEHCRQNGVEWVREKLNQAG